MQQDKFDQQQEKNGRRSRKDQQGRDYVCGCGKSYLSYPALYTHIKTKHDGQRPEGTCKVGVLAAKKSNSSNNNNNAVNPAASNNNRNFVFKHGYITAPIVTGKKVVDEVIPPNHELSGIKSRLNWKMLEAFESLTEYSDFPLISQLSLTQQFGDKVCFVQPDNRIVKQKVGEQLYNVYLQLVKQGELLSKQGEQQQEVYEPKFNKLGNKNEPEYIMVLYLLGAGRYAGDELMDIYMEFCRLFRQCYVDHGEQVYEVCFMKGQADTKEHQKQQIRQRQNPYKYYEYSYAPSSSKSKSYQNYQSNHTQSSPTNTVNVINKKQCKYLPIISQFFVRVFIATGEHNEQTKQIMEFICADFCSWLYKSKLTVVDVALIKKYTLKHVNYSKSSPDKNSKTGKTPLKQKDKPKRSPFKIKRNPRQSSKKSQRGNSNNAIQQEGESSGNHRESDHNDEEMGSNGDSHGQNEDSYKIGHEIVHELAGRDRSGSIQQYINGHEEGVDEAEGIEPHHERPARNTAHSLDEEQIEQYINP